MTTTDLVIDRALALSDLNADTDSAVQELLTIVGEHRVSVVMARQRLLERLTSEPDNRQVVGAADLLEAVLGRLPV